MRVAHGKFASRGNNGGSQQVVRPNLPSSRTWVVPAFLVRGFWDELERRGVSARELEHLSGMTRPRRDDFSSTLSERRVYELYEAALALTGDAALGISVGNVLSAASLHLVGQLILSSVTLRQALELAIRAAPHVYRRMLWVEELAGERVRLGHFGEPRPTPGARIDAELTAVFLYKFVTQFLLGPAETLTVQFAFPPPEDATIYLGVFAGRVQFDADGTFVVLPRAALDRRRSGVDPALSQRLFRLAQEQYGTAHAAGDAAWTDRVRHVLRTQAAPRLVDPRALSGQLGLSLRALARRLAREGVSLSTLVDEVLYDRARMLLRRPNVTSKEVSAELGYAELSSFFRAFRRWSGGLTPSEYRQSQQAGDSFTADS